MIHRWYGLSFYKDFIKMDLQEIVLQKEVDWLHVDQGRWQW
jgi:hypothetical protein